MANGLIFGADDIVCAWTWREYNLMPIYVNLAVGILNDDQDLVGSIMFASYTGKTVNLSYYGENTLSIGICRSIARIALEHFNIDDIVVNFPAQNARHAKRLEKLGFVFRAALVGFYGPGRNALSYVMPHNRIIQLARLH